MEVRREKDVWEVIIPPPSLYHLQNFPSFILSHLSLLCSSLALCINSSNSPTSSIPLSSFSSILIPLFSQNLLLSFSHSALVLLSLNLFFISPLHSLPNSLPLPSFNLFSPCSSRRPTSQLFPLQFFSY